MKRKILLFLTFISAALFQSCNKDINQQIVGMWSIDTIYYKETDIKLCLYSNVIQFSDQSCELPDIDIRCNIINESGSNFWEIKWEKQNPLILHFYGSNHIFNGNHELIFKKDEINKLLKMEIKSENLLIICRKGLFNYDNNIDEIDKLIKISSNR